jgi:hypothetical protein
LAELVEELVAEHSRMGVKPVRIWAAHRVGLLNVGDLALVCAVSAAHRGQAFSVCSEVVNRIKDRVPIWKEQFFEDGTVEWVGAGQTIATRPTQKREHRDRDHFDWHFNNPVRCPRYVRRTLEVSWCRRRHHPDRSLRHGGAQFDLVTKHDCADRCSDSDCIGGTPTGSIPTVEARRPGPDSK